jgi:hypothetical protein
VLCSTGAALSRSSKCPISNSTSRNPSSTTPTTSTTVRSSTLTPMTSTMVRSSIPTLTTSQMDPCLTPSQSPTMSSSPYSSLPSQSSMCLTSASASTRSTSTRRQSRASTRSPSLAPMSQPLRPPSTHPPHVPASRCHRAAAKEKFLPWRLQEIKDTRVLDPICWVFNIYGSSIGDRGVLFLCDFGLLIPVRGIIASSLVENWLVISAPIATDLFESKYWDPGLAGVAWVINHASSRADFHRNPGLPDASPFIEFARSCVAFRWDPGSPKELQSIEFLNYGVDCVPTYIHGFPILLLAQRKCGGYTGRDIHYLLFVSAQWQFSVLSFNGGSLACIVFKLSPTAVMWCIKDVTFIWIFSSMVCLSIANSSKFLTAPEGIWEPSTFFAIYMDLAVPKTWQYSLLVQIPQMDKFCVTGIWKIGDLLF